MLRFFSHSFIASDGSEGSTAGRVASPCSIMMHHGFRCKEARRARKQRYRLRQTASHSSLLVAHQGVLSRILTKRISWLTRSTSILLMKNVQIYICSHRFLFFYMKGLFTLWINSSKHSHYYCNHIIIF